MVGNLHSIGEQLQNALRPEVSGHEIRLKTCKGTSEPIIASSPPIGQEIVSETGLDFASQNRVFYIQVADLEAQELGLPELNWSVIDTSDDSVWRVIPEGNDYGWRWHGQCRTAVQLITKQDK